MYGRNFSLSTHNVPGRNHLSANKTAAVSTNFGVSDDSKVVVNSDVCTVTDKYITSKYWYHKNNVEVKGKEVLVTPKSYQYTFQTERKVPKTGVMLVGWGGNNGTTVTGAMLANKHGLSWKTKEGVKKSNYFGSVTQATTVKVGVDNMGKDVHTPFKTLCPMVDPNDLVVGGWDINGANLAEGMERACVFDVDLQRQLAPMMKDMKPLRSIYYPDFIAANQNDRADNVYTTGTKLTHLNQIRKDIRDFKAKHGLGHLSILWTANTERFTEVRPGLNMTAAEILNSIQNDEPEISPSNIFAVASILEGCPYINGSPQNTLVPGIIELAAQKGVFIAGDDFKSGQTKMKSVLVDFMVSAGFKPESIVSYNHLGNNDGKNLSAPRTFRSKEISKSNVVDDMVAMNHLLYAPGEHPDHTVVIKYVPFVKDSKRAMDEYINSIFMGGLNTISLHNTCEDSLLASPLIIDLVIVTELFSRVKYLNEQTGTFQNFDSILSVLSYWLKAPLVPAGTPVINALAKQQRCVTNILCALLGLTADTDMGLEHKTTLPREQVLRANL